MNGIRKLASRIVSAALAAYPAVLLLIGCSERAPTVPVAKQLSALVVVSAPVGQSGAVVEVARSLGRAATTATVAGDDSVVYVSMAPGSAPGGENATVRNVATGQVLTVTMADGGFDPAPLGGTVGDTLEVDVTLPTGIETYFGIVPRRRPPTLVRSNPPNGKTDVPLNTRITVVFSEPIDQTTVPASMQLFQGADAVAGTATLDSSGLVATFAPDSLLAPNAEYTAVITTTVRNLAGDALEQSAPIRFTTGTLSTGLPPSQGISQCPANSPISSAAFERVGSMALARKGAATALPDGRVLIFGGTPDAGLQPQAEIYDPATRTFAAGDQMMTSRGGHPAVMLPEGKLLFLDGIVLQDGRVFFATPVSIYLQLQDGPFSPPNYAEIYDPTSGTFARLNDHAQAPIYWDTATLLLDGRVLLTGTTADLSNVTELFDPRTNTFKNTGAMQGWYDTSGWGTLLADGTVLFVEWCFEVCNDAVELYDPSSETFTVVGSINGDLPLSRSVRLANGRVLITGGQWPGGNGTNETLLYIPASRTLVQGPPMTCGRHEHSATLLPDGTVLIAGGYSAWPGRTRTAEIFHPPTQ